MIRFELRRTSPTTYSVDCVETNLDTHEVTRLEVSIDMTRREANYMCKVANGAGY